MSDNVISLFVCSGFTPLWAISPAVISNIEQKISVQKLLMVTAGEKVFTSPSTSVHTLAHIAISQLLSPSYADHSISMDMTIPPG